MYFGRVLEPLQLGSLNPSLLFRDATCLKSR